MSSILALTINIAIAFIFGCMIGGIVGWWLGATYMINHPSSKDNTDDQGV